MELEFGAIEAGGTKFVCGIGNEHGEISQRTVIPTTTPSETIQRVAAFFQGASLAGIGIGSFGPIDVNKHSITYGNILNTPKPYWRNFSFVSEIRKYWDVPIGFDTDVNAAALAENRWGASSGLDSCLYITVGTGIGAGFVLDGSVLNGISHPEMGHIFVRKAAQDQFQGVCPFHQDCLEGLASGSAISARWGEQGRDLVDESKVWELEAYYLSEALVNYLLILSPHKIVMGGGVMKQQQLFPLIRQNVSEKLNGYLDFDELNDDQIDQYIVPPKLGDDAGLKGALVLALNAYQS